jgi:uncharacterized membrane protein
MNLPVLWTAVLGVFLMIGLSDTPLQPLSTPKPTPTLKACLACEDLQVFPGSTEQATATVKPPIATAEPVADQLTPVARGVMFWMDGCTHCEDVMAAVLPPLQQRHGPQLDMRLIEVVSTEDMDRLYRLADAYGVPKEQVGVPLVVIGERALSGSEQIPAELPGLVESHLARGGVDFPDLAEWPGVPSAPAYEGTQQIVPFPTLGQTLVAPAALAPPPVRAATGVDGFALAMVAMAAMLLALGYVSGAIAWAWQGAEIAPQPAWLQAAVPLLSLAGLGVAGYLAYVETQAVPAVCGPVGDCNAVQSSPYARLLGVLPVGVAGVAGYLAILGAWLWARLGSGRLADFAPLAVFGMALCGVLFSVYLTYLEPFVIGAVCIWCVTSAVIMTLLMLSSLRPALQASGV